MTTQEREVSLQLIRQAFFRTQGYELTPSRITPEQLETLIQQNFERHKEEIQIEAARRDAFRVKEII